MNLAYSSADDTDQGTLEKSIPVRQSDGFVRSEHVAKRTFCLQLPSQRSALRYPHRLQVASLCSDTA